MDKCEFCHRERELTKHHLIPKKVHSKHKFQRLFSKKEMRQQGIMICQICHSGIHRIISDEKELAECFHTKELLLADERIQKHIKWSRKQKCG
jgi:hypothetical protein